VNVSQADQKCRHCHGKGVKVSNVKGALKAKVCDCFQCEACGNEGKLFHEDGKGRSFMADCECQVFRQRVRMLSEAGLPGKYARATLETYQPLNASQKTALSRVNDFLDDFKNKPDEFIGGLVLMGNSGTGKTHLCVAIVKHLVMKLGIPCKFVDFFQLLSDIRQGYSEEKAEKSIIEPFVESRVLIIDELGKGKKREWAMDMLDQFISARYNSGDKVTLYTTNYKNELPKKKKAKAKSSFTNTADDGYLKSYEKETLAEVVEERIYSRLSENSQFLELEGDDFRKIMKGRTPS